MAAEIFNRRISIFETHREKLECSLPNMHAHRSQYDLLIQSGFSPYAREFALGMIDNIREIFASVCRGETNESNLKDYKKILSNENLSTADEFDARLEALRKDDGEESPRQIRAELVKYQNMLALYYRDQAGPKKSIRQTVADLKGGFNLV